ncbi:hypothetical protein [Nocardioides bruguierae]|uniref:Uncharacterized protein n=1 Tax=Nocardioides bruguierae TaxID=2945102 RepID=A0A9X2D6Z4_9ACTN|nr:hypothetical protein [Nocardioides bruguierae]MCL8023978.1 hypothetical protein [Nocardioides bruguierae]MCM0620358.1 hypothetical protein [Nocardioides bruguierae]
MFRFVSLTQLAAGWAVGLLLAVAGTTIFWGDRTSEFGFLTAVLAMPLLGSGALAGIAFVAGPSRASWASLGLAAAAFVLVLVAWSVLATQVTA